MHYSVMDTDSIMDRVFIYDTLIGYGYSIQLWVEYLWIWIKLWICIHFMDTLFSYEHSIQLWIEHSWIQIQLWIMYSLKVQMT